MNLKKIFDSNFDSQLKKVLSEEDYEGYTIKICELKSDRADEGRIGYAIYEGDDFLTWGSGYDSEQNALKFAKEDVDDFLYYDELVHQLALLGDERPDVTEGLRLDGKDLLSSLVDAFRYWVDTYNDGYFPEMDASDNYSKWLTKKYIYG